MNTKEEQKDSDNNLASSLAKKRKKGEEKKEESQEEEHEEAGEQDTGKEDSTPERPLDSHICIICKQEFHSLGTSTVYNHQIIKICSNSLKGKLMTTRRLHKNSGTKMDAER